MKYHFEILYEPKEWKQVSEFLNKCDMLDKPVCKRHIMEFISKMDLDIEILKTLIKYGYKEVGSEVHMIEGWKHE